MIAISILFAATSLLVVIVTFEKKSRSFERSLLAPIPLDLSMLAKTSGHPLRDHQHLRGHCARRVSEVAWSLVLPAGVLIAVTPPCLGLYIAVSVGKVSEP